MSLTSELQAAIVRNRGIWFIAAILVTSIAAVISSVYSLGHGIYDVHQFLYFIPIILCVWYSPQRGVIFSLVLSTIYLALVYIVGGFNPELVAISTAWFVIFVTIGVVTSSFAQGSQNERRKFRGIFDNSQAGIFTCERSSMRICEINPKCARILQTDPSALLGRPLADIIPDHEEFTSFVREIQRNQQVTDLELHVTTNTGEIRQVLISASVSMGNTVICSVADITERKMAERVIRKARDELEQRVTERTRELTKANEVLSAEIDERKQFEEAIRLANRKLNMLSSITRHDILNQVSAIVMYLSLAEEEVNDPEKMKTHLKKIGQVTDLIQKQIRFTHDYQYIGTRPPMWQGAAHVVDSGLKHLDTGNLRVEKNLGDLEILADFQLEKVIHNLVENTLSHGEHATFCRFSYRVDDDRLTLVYEDDGIGIPAGAKEKIFKREYYRHTGYGLFLALEILGTTGMTMQETGEPGKGVRFKITVPKGVFRFPETGTAD